jgi:uncharacterized protein involved in exopolysaccharide biosynthesis
MNLSIGNFLSRLKASVLKPIAWALCAGILAALYSLTLPNHYRSEARLLPLEGKGLGSSLGGLAGAAAAFGVSMPGGDGGDANYVDILNSRSLRENLANTEFEYSVRESRFGAIKAKRGTLAEYLDADNIDRAVGGVASLLSVSRDLKTKVLIISAETKSAELSQKIVVRAQRLLEAFLQTKGRTRGSAKALFAEARLAEARKEAAEAEEGFMHFLLSNRNYMGSADPTVRLTGLRLEAELKLRQQLVATLALNREQALLEEKNDMPILNVLDPGNLPVDKSGPARANLVLLVMLLGGAAAWILYNRVWLQQRLAALATIPTEPSDRP